MRHPGLRFFLNYTGMAVLVLLVVAGGIETRAAPGPTTVNSVTRPDGWQVIGQSQLQPVQINRIHNWEITVLYANGQPVNNARFRVEGGMPDHDHGLPTEPRVTSMLENGHYLLEGVRFHMPGRWQLQMTITVDDQVNTVVLEFSL